MQIPKFLQELISSPEYSDKNSETYKRATKYMNILYPGTVQFDATGRMARPEYDMTLEQFNAAQGEIDAEFDAALGEAYEEIMSEYGDYFENIGESFYIDIDTGDAIPVKVLMPNGNIIEKYLDTYELHIPDINIAPKIWRWHSENGENTCDECATMNNRVFFSPDKIPSIPVHPNCQCSITEETLGKNGKTINIKPYKPTQESDKESVPTFASPVNTKPGQYAVFDGKKFTLYENDKPIMSWDAVSGKDGYRSPEYQNLKDTGPIPEGTYVARQSELQHITLPDAVLGVAAIVGKQIGSWPGSYYSWGGSRVWLEPSKETQTYDRDDFSIHGGWNLGSAGCIDMTGQINAFTSWLESTGKDLIVHVKY